MAGFDLFAEDLPNGALAVEELPEVSAPDFNCVGTAGTAGTYSCCAGTAGTFGSAS